MTGSKGLLGEESEGLRMSGISVTNRGVPSYRQMPKDRRYRKQLQPESGVITSGGRRVRIGIVTAD